MAKLFKLVLNQNSYNFPGSSAKKWIKCHTIWFFFNNTIIVQVRYIIIETKEIARIGYNGFLFLHSYSGNGIGATHLGLHLSTHAEKETVISNTGNFQVLFQ